LSSHPSINGEGVDANDISVPSVGARCVGGCAVRSARGRARPAPETNNTALNAISNIFILRFITVLV